MNVQGRLVEKSIEENYETGRTRNHSLYILPSVDPCPPQATKILLAILFRSQLKAQKQEGLLAENLDFEERNCSRENQVIVKEHEAILSRPSEPEQEIVCFIFIHLSTTAAPGRTDLPNCTISFPLVTSQNPKILVGVETFIRPDGVKEPVRPDIVMFEVGPRACSGQHSH
jgi:hypothetical protein